MRAPLATLACLLLCAAHGQSLLPAPAKPIGLLQPAKYTITRTTLPAPWSYQHLGLFCKLDVQLERRARLPVLIRLGDAMQVEAWEGKGPLRPPPVH
jgi:uncharacterized protein with NAD-binding domain and iron-sulfur cluster